MRVRQRLEHWRTALQQGRVAAHNMMGENVAYNSVPIFWTQQFDGKFVYVGHTASRDEIIIQSDLSAEAFLAFYVKDGRVPAVAAAGREKLRYRRAPIYDVTRLARRNLAS